MQSLCVYLSVNLSASSVVAHMQNISEFAVSIKALLEQTILH